MPSIYPNYSISWLKHSQPHNQPQNSSAKTRVHLPEQKQTLGSQKKPDATEKATATQRTQNKSLPKEASMLYRRKTDSNTPVSAT